MDTSKNTRSDLLSLVEGTNVDDLSVEGANRLKNMLLTEIRYNIVLEEEYGVIERENQSLVDENQSLHQRNDELQFEVDSLTDLKKLEEEKVKKLEEEKVKAEVDWSKREKRLEDMKLKAELAWSKRETFLQNLLANKCSKEDCRNCKEELENLHRNYVILAKNRDELDHLYRTSDNRNLNRRLMECENNAASSRNSLNQTITIASSEDRNKFLVQALGCAKADKEKLQAEIQSNLKCIEDYDLKKAKIASLNDQLNELQRMMTASVEIVGKVMSTLNN